VNKIKKIIEKVRGTKQKQQYEGGKKKNQMGIRPSKVNTAAREKEVRGTASFGGKKKKEGRKD